MISVGCRYVSMKSPAKQGFSALLPKSKDFSHRELTSTSLVATPVKLAYASYESTKGTSTEGSSNPPVMIMHGLFGSKTNWNSLAKSIHQKTDRKVIAIDARNHGDSPHSSEASYDHMAKDVVHLLKDLGIEKAVLIGHSMGGSTMMYLALNYPQLVEKLVVVDMSPVRSNPDETSMRTIFEAMRSVTLNGNMSLSKARRTTDQQLSTNIGSVTLRQFLMTNLVEAETGKFKWRINLPVLEKNFSQITTFPDIGTKTFRGPTLFVGGANSDYINVDDHEGIKRMFPAAEFHYIAGAGHWVHAEKPAEFLNAVITFINRTN